ncbi:MAG: hypothetical protein JWQ35_703 [Bacteriovoracaceae bacterium]|nr:hypothetical protein [Bacteriovoracaceae bacterium]
MQLNINHAKEFAKILGLPDLKPNSIQNDGNFLFNFKSAKEEGEKVIDPGIIAGLIQLSKAVGRGDTPADQLSIQVANIKKELGL